MAGSEGMWRIPQKSADKPMLAHRQLLRDAKIATPFGCGGGALLNESNWVTMTPQSPMRRGTGRAIAAALLAFMPLSLSLSAHAGSDDIAAQMPGEITELFWDGDVGTSLKAAYATATQTDQIPVGDGLVTFVRHSDGSIGIASEGITALRLVNTLTTFYRATPLEMFSVLARAGERPSRALESDHERRMEGGDPQQRTSGLPDFDELVQVAETMGNSGGPISPDPLCSDNWFPNWELFTDPDYGDNKWDGHDYGTGRASLVNANLSLGPSRAGTMMFCAPPDIAPGGDFTEDDYFEADARLIVQEYVAGLGWMELWSRDTVVSGDAYGYSYDGIAVHQLRMAIRDVSIPNPIGDYMWSGAY